MNEVLSWRHPCEDVFSFYKQLLSKAKISVIINQTNSFRVMS